MRSFFKKITPTPPTHLPNPQLHSPVGVTVHAEAGVLVDIALNPYTPHTTHDTHTHTHTQTSIHSTNPPPRPPPASPRSRSLFYMIRCAHPSLSASRGMHPSLITLIPLIITLSTLMPLMSLVTGITRFSDYSNPPPLLSA